MKKGYYIIESERNSPTKNFMKIVFGILLFAVILFPFYGILIREKIGEILKETFDWFGKMCFLGGGVFLLIAVVGIFTGGGRWMKHAAIGIALLWVGCWCTGVAVDFLGITIGKSVISTENDYINTFGI